MRALSVSQPYASLIAVGAKRIETRSWRTRYRGALAIHASSTFPVAYRRLVEVEPFRTALRGLKLESAEESACQTVPIETLPLGVIVAICHLEACYPVDVLLADPYGDRPSDQEIAFGNYAAGRWGWMLSGVRALSNPVPCSGQLGLWEVPVDVQDRLAEEIGLR